MKKILVADVPQMDERYSAAFTGWEVAFARTLAQAHQALDAGSCAVVVTGVYFDDSRMFDLLRHLQASGQDLGCAVICMRSQHFVSPAITIEGLEIAAKALGCNVFLDLTWYADDATGNGAIRSLLEALLKP